MPTRRDAGELLTDTLCSWVQEIIPFERMPRNPPSSWLFDVRVAPTGEKPWAFYKGHQNARRSLCAHATGHLLRRTADREEPPRHDREGNRPDAKERFRDASRGDKRPDRPS